MLNEPLSSISRHDRIVYGTVHTTAHIAVRHSNPRISFDMLECSGFFGGAARPSHLGLRTLHTLEVSQVSFLPPLRLPSITSDRYKSICSLAALHPESSRVDVLVS